MGYLMVKSNCFGLTDYFRQLGFADTEQAAQFFALAIVLARYWKICPLFSSNFTCNPQLKVPEGARKNYERSLIQRWATGCGIII